MNDTTTRDNGGYSLFVPVLLLALALVGTLAYQTRILVVEQQNLRNLIARQQQPLSQAQGTLNQFRALLAGAAKLGQQGNPHAQAFIDDLAKRGISVKLGEQTPQQ